MDTSLVPCHGGCDFETRRRNLSVFFLVVLFFFGGGGCCFFALLFIYILFIHLLLQLIEYKSFSNPNNFGCWISLYWQQTVHTLFGCCLPCHLAYVFSCLLMSHLGDTLYRCYNCCLSIIKEYTWKYNDDKEMKALMEFELLIIEK